MREEIIELLGKEKRALSASEICDKLNLNTAGELKKLLDNLRILEEGYTVYRSNKDKYMLFENSHLLKGRLSVNKKGFGFVVVDGRDEDIYIDAKNMNGALNNDLVVVEELKGQNGKKTEGRVVKVLKKENNLIVGEYKIIDGNPHFIPDDKKLRMEIILDNKDLDDLVDGHKIQVSIVKEMGKYKYLGEVVKIIGHKNDPGVDILSIIYDHGINDVFTDEVMEEVNALPSEVLDSDRKGRKDLTDMTIFTIDGDDTKDIDDAISISKKGENYILGVHIADVSYYVKEGTALYKEAYSRGTSVYLVDRVVPMLPHKLSNGICSLNPNVDRLAISCIMEITPNGKIVSHDIFESIIRSRIQMTYKKVNKILNDEETPEGYEPFKDDLKLMWELAKILRKEKLARGYLDFDVDEPKILIVEDDRIIADNVCEQLLKWGYDVKIADDINVLIAKVQAMLRRTYSFAESTNIIEHNGCILNLNDQTFTYNGKRIELTKNEYRILQSLLENIGKVVSRDNIMMKLWESDDFIDDNTLTVNVTRLRKKLEQAGLIDYIKTKKVPEYRQI